MKKLLIVLSVVCLGAFGLTGSVLAADTSPAPRTLNCDESEYVCIEDDLYEVSFNCDGDEMSPATQNLYISDLGTFDLEVVNAEPAFECVISGDIDAKKTEVKCTEADKGPNKGTGHGNAQHTTGALQADAEIKLILEDSEDCLL